MFEQISLKNNNSGALIKLHCVIVSMMWSASISNFERALWFVSSASIRRTEKVFFCLT